jgi:hypothetical protein
MFETVIIVERVDLRGLCSASLTLREDRERWS